MATSDDGDWRTECSDVAAMQSEARKRGLFTDIQFVFNTPDSEETVKAHKQILACGSIVFEKMFYGALAEERNVIPLEDDDLEAFNMLLNYFYGKMENLSSVISAWKCYTIADKYLVTGLKNEAEKYMLSLTMNEKTLWEIIENNIHSIPSVEQKIIAYVQGNPSKLFKPEKYHLLPESIMDSVLQMDEMNFGEVPLLVSLTEWAIRRLSNPSSKDLLLFYKYIRFSNLERKDFCEFVRRFPNAIDAEDSLKILMHLIHRAIYPLPEWCSKNINCRNIKYVGMSPCMP